jgi:hypothetical protein
MCSAVLHYIHIHLSFSLWGRTEGQQEGRIYNCSVTDSFNSSFYSRCRKAVWAGLGWHACVHKSWPLVVLWYVQMVYYTLMNISHTRHAAVVLPQKKQQRQQGRRNCIWDKCASQIKECNSALSLRVWRERGMNVCNCSGMHV